MPFLFTTDTSSVRVAALDAVHSRRRSAVVVGPLNLPTTDELAVRLKTMSAAGPVARLCLAPSATSTRWSRVDEAEAPRVYNVAPQSDPITLLRTVRALDNHGVTVAASGEWLAIDFSHGLGEIPLIHTLLDVLFGVTDAEDPATWRRYRRSRSPLRTAAVATFGVNPARLAKLAASQCNRRTFHEDVDADVMAAVAPFISSPTTRAMGMNAAQVDELRARRDLTLPGVSMVALFTCALRAAFAEVGIAVADTVKIPFDVRRYLPAGTDTLASFSAGLDFVVDDADGPKRLQNEMATAAKTGRPVANLLVGSMKARHYGPDDSAGHTVAESPRLQLLHSDLGSAQWNGPWPFTDAEKACMLVASDPATAAGVTVTTVEVAGNRWFTAEFHRTVFDPDAIGAALDLLPHTATRLLP
jgi:hypothetical protein